MVGRCSHHTMHAPYSRDLSTFVSTIMTSPAKPDSPINSNNSRSVFCRPTRESTRWQTACRLSRVDKYSAKKTFHSSRYDSETLA